MRPRSCRPINCRPCLPLSASSEERHRPSPIASGSADVADQGVHPPADPPTPPLRNAAPSIRPSGEHRPANQRLPGRLSLAQPRAHHASGDRSVILRIVESRLAAREPQLRSRQHKVLSCLHENIISRNAQLLMSLRLNQGKYNFWDYMGAIGPLLYRRYWHDLGGQPSGWEGVYRFFCSPYFSELPVPYINCRLGAELLTGNEPIAPGDAMDVDLLSVALPIAHYILADRRMEQRIRKLRLDEKCGAEVYSMSTIDGLFDRLEHLR